MSIKQRLEQDIKTALLSGDKVLVTTLRGLKSAILYVEVAKGSRDAGLPDDEIISLFAKEAKKRQESADLYVQGGNTTSADHELAEKKIIEGYLPAQLSDTELDRIVTEVLSELGEVSPKVMGVAIGQVKQRVGATVEGSRIALAVKKGLGS